MRRGSWAAVGVAWVLCACGSLELNPGRRVALHAATAAGQFRVATGRWPADGAELDQYLCRTALGEMDRDTVWEYPCDGPEPPPFLTELRPSGSALLLTVRDRSRRSLCRLRLSVPAPGAPLVRVRTSLFSCPGKVSR
jgi:hypothetical protein